MSKTLDLIMGTMRRLLQEARPSTGDSMQGNDSHLYWLILSQLQRTKRVLDDFSKELVLDWHGLIYDELFRVVTRISTLVQDPGDISIPAEAREEHFLEALLDLRWWTWVIALQVETFLTNLTLYNSHFGEFEGVSEAKFTSLSLGRISMTRRLPSYSFELWQQETEGRLRGILQCKSMDHKMKMRIQKGVQGENEVDMLLTEIRNAELPDFEIKQLGSVKVRDAGKLSSIRDHLVIDLTKDLLGASPTGYVIKTTLPDGQGRSYFCALKRIDTMDENEPDLARLWHPHVVHLMHHWREKSGLHDEVRGWMPTSTFMIFLVMELMDGDLAKLITRIKKIGVTPFSLLVTVDIMLQIAKGMLYLHEMGVSHPHLKCDNILCRVESNTQAPFRVGDVLVKLSGFGYSRTANDDTKNRDVFCFGLTCLEILTGDELSEDIYGSDKVLRPSIPGSTPPILKHCIASCLDTNLTFSEVVMLLLLAQCQIMQTRNDVMMLCSENLHIEIAQTNNQDLASSSRSKAGLQEMFHVHQIHPQLRAGPTSAQMTLIFFHGFPKVSEEWRMTWMTRDNKLVWPQMWLPEDLDGDICVLSVSFDDHPDVNSTQTIKNLLHFLVSSAMWKLGETEQTIILVGHSFGGVIIKALVTEAESLVGQAGRKRSDSGKVMKCKRFLKSLASVVFYSVPHALTNTEFKNYISGCSNTRVLQRSSLLKSLRGDSRFVPAMIELSRDFESAVAHKTKVLAILEGKPMSKKCLLVRETSCEKKMPSWEWHKVDKDNHFEVCRPDSKSHTGYKILLNHIKQHTFSPSDITTSTINVDYSKPVNDLDFMVDSFGEFFPLHATERSINQFTCAIRTEIPIKGSILLQQGRLVLSSRFLGFCSKLFGHETQFTLLWEEIEEIKKRDQSINPSIIIFMRKGRGLDARHGARGIDGKGRLKFQFLSFVSIETSFRAIAQLWKNRKLSSPQKMDVLAIKEAADTMYDITEERQADDYDLRIELAATSEVVHREIPITNFSTKLSKTLMKSGKALTKSGKDSRKSGKNSRMLDKGSTKAMRARSGNAARSKTDPPFVSLASRHRSTSNFHQVEEVDESTLMSDLITKLSSQQIEVHRDAAKKIKHLTRMNKENRRRIAEQGGIGFLIHHLRSPDKMTQEHAITALMYLSLEENVRGLIMIRTEAIDGIVHVVKFGHSMEARENAAAAIQCLSYENENKISIGNAGAIPALVELLRVGTHQGKKAAANALCKLVSFQEGNKRRAVETDLISVLMDILHSDHSTNELDEISLCILANLSLYPDGLIDIGNTQPAAMLVDFITWGSYKGKELSTALLCKLCSDDPSFIETAYHCGATSPLAALLRDDNTTDRCKRNATQLLDLLTACADPAFYRVSKATKSHLFKWKSPSGGPGFHQLLEAGGRRKIRPSFLFHLR